MTASPTDPKRGILIWLGDTDPKGRPIHPQVREAAYEIEPELIRYCGKELHDKAEVASLIEEAAYKTSRVAYKVRLDHPDKYLFRTYSRMVKRKLRRAVKLFGVERQILETLAQSRVPFEEQMLRAMSERDMMESMDLNERSRWEKHLLGFDVPELAAEEGKTVDYMGKLLRRSAERALRRLINKDRE